jgi:hypothetical protein
MNYETYHAGFLGKLKNFIPFCLLDDKHQRLSMFAFSPFILQEAIQKLKHNHGTTRVSYQSTNLLWAKPIYV